MLKSFIHIFSIANVKKAHRYLQHNGTRATIRKILSKVLQVLNHPTTQNSLDTYQIWIKNNEPTKKELEAQKNINFKYSPKISIVVPMYKTDINFFKDLILSVQNQTYTNWELCLADGSPEENNALKTFFDKDARIKYYFIGENKGISGNTNEAIKMVTGDYIGLLDHDDTLPPFSLFEVVKCINNNPEAELIYSDEDKIDLSGETRCDPHFKPDFAPDFLKANNYICHFSVLKKSLMEKLGGERSKYDGAQDFDLVLRASEETSNIIHISKVLYHWRAHPNSTAQSTNPVKSYAYEAGIFVIQDHLKRQGIKGKVSYGNGLGTYRVKYDVIGTPKVSIIIPSKDGVSYLRDCLNSILKKTTYSNYEIIIVENNSVQQNTFDFYDSLKSNHKIKVLNYPEKGFNYSKIINFGVKNCNGEYVVQLNNDIKILTTDWLEDLLGFAQREDVGAVGVKAYYPDKSIQHAGVIIGMHTVANHIFKHLPAHHGGYMGREGTIQNFSAVTGACMMSKKSIYEEVGYMDEGFPVAFNDIDFCLKIREAGKLIIYDPFVEVIHDESKTRRLETETPEKLKRFQKDIERFLNKWPQIYEKGDPYYNKNFSLESQFCNLNIKKQK